MRTSRLTGAAALLATLLLAVPAGAQPAAQNERCPEEGLGPRAGCLVPEDGPVSSVARDESDEDEPGPALWVGAVFGVSGLAGILFATGRIRDSEADEQR